MADRATAVICMNTEIAARVLPHRLRERLAGAVLLGPDAPPGGLTESSRLADAEILITGWGCPPLDEAVLRAAPRLRAVVHAAGSVRHLVTSAAWRRGLVVSSAASANAGPVADFTYAAVVMAAKQALPTAARSGAGWPGFAEREGADGRTVGIIGASRIGRRVVSRLNASGAGYRILVADPYADSGLAGSLGVEVVPLDELCRRSSIISVHAPELPETWRLLDSARLALIPDGGTVINTSRGSLIDTEALTRECASGRLSAFLDVTSPEPLPPDHPLLSLRNVLVTPHIAGAQGSEVVRLGEFAVAEVERLVRGESPAGQVTEKDMGRLA